MPLARNWTEDADMTIRVMRAGGATWAAIGDALGLSRNTVIERGRRLCAAAPEKLKNLQITKETQDDPNRGPLPAGHPATWGLLSDQAYPAVEDRDGNDGLVGRCKPVCGLLHNLSSPTG